MRAYPVAPTGVDQPGDRMNDLWLENKGIEDVFETQSTMMHCLDRTRVQGPNKPWLTHAGAVQTAGRPRAQAHGR